MNGIREFAHVKGATITYVPVREADLRVDEEQLQTVLRGTRPAEDRLFAYPAQSNFSGVHHPLAWVDEAHELGWDVLLDCAAYAPTNPMDLEVLKPDFVPISFYKLFGYPTGVGCLIARREKLAKLRRPWFAGGTITLASVQADDWYRLAPGATGFEDGTLDYLGLPAVTIGLEHLAAVGVATVHRRVSALAGWFLEEARRLRHSNGAPLIKVFGPQDMDRRGATIALYIVDPQGHAYDVYDVEKAAGRRAHLGAHGLLLQPRRRRGGARHHARGDGGLLRGSHRGRDADAVPAAHRGHHRQGAQHDPRVARAGLGFRRRVSLPDVRREVPRPVGAAGTSAALVFS